MDISRRRTKEEKEEEEDGDIFYSPKRSHDTGKGHDESSGDIYSFDDDDNEEIKKITRMRSMVQWQDPACKGVDDLTLRRFLRARDLDVEKASAMFLKYLAWRRTFVPKGSVAASEIPNELAHDKMFLQGRDKQGHPISVILGARHLPCKGGLEEYKRFMVFALDKLCSRTTDGQEKFTIIADLQGYGYANSDFRGMVATVSILQDYYPERLGKMLFIHVPYLFMTLWKMIYPFVDKKTKKKIIFVENKKLETSLLEEIDESQLPEIYGGKLKLVRIQDA